MSLDGDVGRGLGGRVVAARARHARFCAFAPVVVGAACRRARGPVVMESARGRRIQGGSAVAGVFPRLCRGNGSVTAMTVVGVLDISFDGCGRSRVTVTTMVRDLDITFHGCGGGYGVTVMVVNRALHFAGGGRGVTMVMMHGGQRRCGHNRRGECGG